LTPDLDIYRSANVLIREHGEANLEAVAWAGATAGVRLKQVAICVNAFCPCSATIDPYMVPLAPA